MSEFVAPIRADVAEKRERLIVATGAGAAAPTVTQSLGCAVTRTGVGVWLITFKENPGRFVGWGGAAFFSTAMTDVKGYSGILGVYNPATFAVAFSIFSSAFAAVDLTAVQFVSIDLYFKETSV